MCVYVCERALKSYFVTLANKLQLGSESLFVLQAALISTHNFAAQREFCLSLCLDKAKSSQHEHSKTPEKLTAVKNNAYLIEGGGEKGKQKEKSRN